MTDDPTPERVQAIIAGIVDRSPAGLGPDTPLTEDGFALDSLDLLRTILACEETFHVVFDPDTDFTDQNLKTVGTLCSLIRSRRSG